ncbi:MAG TPA: RNA methyltransferase [Oscillatoriaceae cyanobacterium M33_DOE_052]|uniref:tRNA (cytidine/uridine-2'-O-)-methyltransferase TrmJ n=1 Tax=Planktothricoides sp. SpSt-374 TaxID=2282167 RepID=A0A7C3ZMP0_9CYAN|nr:RNA methyltransferase [Oscillatoriaceae cyanobacterium M33_DOE_052]
MDESLARVRIILVEPAGELNIGSIARVMKNMGLRQLVLVNPQCEHLGAQARQMAVHAADILETAIVVGTLPEALTGCYRAIATTARERSVATTLEHPRDALPWLLETPSALIFGPEDRGLSNAELNYAGRFVRIPSSPAYPSLNLAESVAICSYELSQAKKQPVTPGVIPPITNPNPPVSLDILEGYYQQLEALLLDIGYLYPHTAASRMEKFRRLYNRAGLSADEVAMLRGILSQVRWALSQIPPIPSPTTGHPDTR